MASVRPTRHGTYEVLYRDPAGRQRSRSFKRKADAALYAKTVDTDKARGDWADPRLARATFGQYAELWWAAAQLRPRTTELYASILRNWVLPRFNDVPVAQIDPPTLRAWAKEITDSGRSASHRAGCINIVRLVLSTAVEAGAIKANPALRLRLPTPAPKAEMRFLTPSQVEALAQEMRDPQGALLIRFAAYTGLRAGEIYALRVKSIRGQRVTVTDSLTELHGPGREQVFLGSTKTYRNRVVSMPGPLAAAVAEHASGRGPDDLVFASADGSPIRHTAFYRDEFKPAVRRAGLDPNLRFHDLRHTCAAMMIRLGAHPKAIMERLGHSTITVTLNTYGHLLPELETALTAGMEGLWASAEPVGAGIR
ncbi:MAG: tyrosine-type recombinase/integrase [Acidimicrobiales bacterium]